MDQTYARYQSDQTVDAVQLVIITFLFLKGAKFYGVITIELTFNN